MKHPAVTTSQIQRIDRLATHDLEIPSLRLMENAGRKSAQIILKDLKPHQRVAILCGRGNNGGDGMVIARYLLKRKIKVKVFLVGKGAGLKPDCLTNYRRFIKIGGKAGEITDLTAFRKLKSKIKNCDFIVDALFGVGLKGNLPSLYLHIIDFLNNTHRPIVAIDVPSGLDATSGRIKGNCIRAYQTISFSLPKKGFYKNQGPRRCGKIQVADIGIPLGLINKGLPQK